MFHGENINFVLFFANLFPYNSLRQTQASTHFSRAGLRFEGQAGAVPLEGFSYLAQGRCCLFLYTGYMAMDVSFPLRKPVTPRGCDVCYPTAATHFWWVFVMKTCQNIEFQARSQMTTSQVLNAS